MKKVFLLLAVVSVGAFSAFAQTISLDGTSGSIIAGQAFTSTITLTIGPNSIGSFNSVNLLLGTPDSGANSGAAYFTITAITPSGSFDNVNQSPPATFSIPGDTANSGSLLTDKDVGSNSSAGVTVASGGGTIQVETITFQSLATIPVGTYNFYASSGGFDDNQGSYIAKTGPEVDYDINQTPIFNIDITAVPEPSTWIAGFAAAGVIGYSMLRRRRATV